MLQVAMCNLQTQAQLGMFACSITASHGDVVTVWWSVHAVWQQRAGSQEAHVQKEGNTCQLCNSQQ